MIKERFYEVMFDFFKDVFLDKGLDLVSKLFFFMFIFEGKEDSDIND